jgi:hypothetical protein
MWIEGTVPLLCFLLQCGHKKCVKTSSTASKSRRVESTQLVDPHSRNADSVCRLVVDARLMNMARCH